MAERELIPDGAQSYADAAVLTPEEIADLVVQASLYGIVERNSYFRILKALDALA